MRFEIVGKTPVRFSDVDPQMQKLGQKKLRPAVLIKCKATTSNKILDQFDTSLRPFLFEKNSAMQTQGALEGVPVVSDLPQLTEAAKRMGNTLSWDAEQGGSKMIVYAGVTGDMDIKLTGTCSKFVFECHEGGTVDTTFLYYATDIDVDTMGQLGVLHQHEPLIELVAPEVMQPQGQMLTGEGEDATLTPGQKLQEAFEQSGTAAEGRAAKGAAKKTPLAKKVARTSRKTKVH